MITITFLSLYFVECFCASLSQGVLGVSWPQSLGQQFPLEPNVCGYINDFAWDVMQAEKIPTIDAYWLTLSRPDHREVVEKENIRTSYKLVQLEVSLVCIFILILG